MRGNLWLQSSLGAPLADIWVGIHVHQFFFEHVPIQGPRPFPAVPGHSAPPVAFIWRAWEHSQMRTVQSAEPVACGWVWGGWGAEVGDTAARSSRFERLE